MHAGDVRAFDGLMARHRGPIVRFAHRLVGDAAEAEDVAQTTFVRAYRTLCEGGFRRTDAQFSTWLYRIARNAALDVARHRRRHPTVSMDLLSKQGVDVPDARRNAGDAVADLDTGAQVAAAVGRLPEEQRAALVLCEYEGLAQDEIAKALGCSVRAVESRLYRARQFLRKALVPLLAERRR